MKKILILASNPRKDLNLGCEIRDLKNVIERSRNREEFEVEIELAVRVNDLPELLLKYRPQIVHFCGHGSGAEGLVFEDEESGEQWLRADALSGLFKLCSSYVECVVLNACYSEKQAIAIVDHINYVIGMSQTIQDNAAIAFSKGFYLALGYGCSIEEAYEFGCNGIQLEITGSSKVRSPMSEQQRKFNVVDVVANTLIPEERKPILKKKKALMPNSNQSESRFKETPSSETRVAIQMEVSKALEQKNSLTANIDLESPDGQVRINSSFYITSSFEERCYEEVRKEGSLIRIKSPHKMGKSSLMVRVLAYAAKEGYRTVSLNLEQANQKFFNDLDKYMQWFCASIGKPLGVKVKIEEYWDDTFGANDNSTDYFEKYLLEKWEQPLVVAIDNFDRVFKYSDIETDFCGLLRGWNERSRSNELWGKLRFIIVYSQEPYLQKDINQSPFNIGLPIELGEFTKAQVQKLVSLHKLDWTGQQVEQFMSLIGGHPYLVRLALYQIAKGDLTLEEFLKTAATEAGIYSEHLLGYLTSLEDYPKLGAAMKSVVSSDSPIRLRSEEAFKLDSMGLVVRVGNDVQPRCCLYQQYFRDRLGV